MSNEIQPDPSNHRREYGSQATSNQVSQNRFLRDLLCVQQTREKYRKERRKYCEIYLPLYQASIRCDWKAAEAILDNNLDMNLLRRSITENGETALHIAVSAKGPKKVDEFVRNLVERMEKEDLELVNNNQNTALYLAAAAGNIETVKIMMEKNSTLDTIPGGGGDMMPLYAAVLFGNEDVARYLYESSKSLANEGWTRQRRTSLLEKCVESNMFDIAIQIVKKYPDLGRRSSNLLGLLARKPEAFREKKSNIIKRTIKSVSAFICCKAGTSEAKSDALPLLRILWGDIVELPNRQIDDILRGPRDSIKSDSGRIVQTIQLKELIFSHLDKLVEEIQTLKEGTLSGEKLEDIVSKHVVNMHVETQSLVKQQNTTDKDQALDLQKLISEYIVKLHDEIHRRSFFFFNENEATRLLGFISNHISKMRDETKIRATYSSRVLFIAAEVGNTNFLLELIRRQPDLIWKIDDNGLSMFHIAVKHRHEGIYNLLYEIGSMKDMVTPLTDNDGNNMLHLAAMSTRKKNLEDVSGAALQMQRELLWFKEVERMIPPYLRERKNKDGFTPRELFTVEHQYLIDQGEKWMKSTASQCMVVAALIATIVFAAAFTVPGGYDQNNGIPIFKRKKTFAAFVVIDAISLFLSSASILTFLSILTSRYAERDFVASLPRKLMLGLVTLFLSIGTMLVTFSVSFFVLYHKGMKWIPIFISLFAVIPAILYVALQFHLLVDVIRSTYGATMSSQALLDLENNNTKESSSLLVCKNGDEEGDKLLKKIEAAKLKANQPPTTKPNIAPAPPSQVLGKLKDFLGIMAESNKKLQQDAMNSKNFDIEALTGDESEYIEMDLMLGVADLNTPEAVAAAESAIDGSQPVISLDASSSESESEDDDDSSDSENGNQSSPMKSKSQALNDKSNNGTSESSKKRKRPKIVELS